MITARYAELLTILKTAPSEGMSTADIFRAASDNLKSLIPDPNETSRMVYKMRIDGAISTSDGKKKMHKITNKGLRYLELFEHAQNEKGTTDEALEAPKSSKTVHDTNSAPIPEPSVQNQTEKALLEPVCHEKAPETVASEQNASVPAIGFDNAIETLARDGYMILDPASESDAFICDLVNRLKRPNPHTVAEKMLKIDTLRNLAPMMSDDIYRVLCNIADDLESLEAA